MSLRFACRRRNIGVFDRSRPLPSGVSLEQVDGTAWMAFYCGTMLSMALELAREDASYEDIASKFFEHYVAIADAMNTLGGSGLWHESDGFYYDQLRVGHEVVPLRIRSLVGLMPLLACEVLEHETLDRLPGFTRRMQWFLDNRPDLACRIAYAEEGHSHRLLAAPGQSLPARRRRAPPVPRRRFAVHGGSTLPRPRRVQRVLPRRHRPRPRRQLPGLDAARHPLPRGSRRGAVSAAPPTTLRRRCCIGAVRR